MAYTLGQAAKATGVSKPTIARAIAKGKISAGRGPSGEWQIEPAELHRVYPPVPADPGTPSQSVVYRETPHETALLQELRGRLADKDAQLDDLRRRLDAAEEERRQLSLRLLTDQRP